VGADMGDHTEVQVNVRTTEQRREQWKKYAAENEDVEHMTHLIHRGVSEYIARHSDESQTDAVGESGVSAGDGDAVLQQLDDVADTLGTLSDSLVSLDKRLSTVEGHVAPSTEIDAGDVVKALPPHRPDDKSWSIARREYGGDDVVWQGTIQALADHFDARKDRVRDAIDRMEKTPIKIHREVRGGTARYWSDKHSNAAEEGEAAYDPRHERSIQSDDP